MLATRNGLVKSKLTDFDSNRSGGIVAVNLRDGDELVGAVLCSPPMTCCWSAPRASRSGSRPPMRHCGRWAGQPPGVQGMRFNADDELLSLNVVREGTYLLVATSPGYSSAPPSRSTPPRAAAVKAS